MAAWPGTPGGASSPHWGPDVRLYVWAAVGTGTTMQWGSVTGTVDTLSAGNVWGSGTPTGPPAPPGSLWVDLSCDVLDVQTSLGAGNSTAFKTRAEAATAQVTLIDPTRKYDPTNPDSPYAFGGVTRLGPGTTLKIWAEVQTGSSTLATYPLFVGTADTWSEAWTPHPGERRAVVVASDAIKALTRLDRGEQPPAGNGDLVHQRISRVLAYYGSAITTRLDASTVPLQSTTLAQSAWELIGRAVDDELGYVAVDAAGTLQFWARDRFNTRPAPTVVVGCPGGIDIVTAVAVRAADANVINSVYASRAGGSSQVAVAQASIDRYGEYAYRRSDLGLQNNSDVATWAQRAVGLFAWPRARLESVTMRPALEPGAWAKILGVGLVDSVGVAWRPPGSTSDYSVAARVFGVDHRIGRRSWELSWSLAWSDVYARVMHWGPHPLDRLTAGNVYT